MGGGGSRGVSLEDLTTLEARARERLRQVAESQRHNVFISFASEDLQEVNLLRAQAKNENSNIEFNDWSLKEPFDSRNGEYIRRGIREKIRQSSVTVVYVSDFTPKSTWVEWEVNESLRLNKHVIAVHKGDHPPSILPDVITGNGIRVVPWKGLAEALRV